jgi:hypothetical protein
LPGIRRGKAKQDLLRRYSREEVIEFPDRRDIGEGESQVSDNKNATEVADGIHQGPGG